MKYWDDDENDFYVKESHRLWDTYLPQSGATLNTELDLLLAANRLIYDFYNNGWGVNNKSGELEYLQDHGYFSEFTFENLVDANFFDNAFDGVWKTSTQLSFDEYVEEELDSIIREVLRVEQLNNGVFEPDLTESFLEQGLDYGEWNKLYAEFNGSDEDDPYDDDEGYWDDDVDDEWYDV